MTKPTTLTISVAKAAEVLAERLGGNPQHWVLWLKNDRRPGRANHVPVVPGPGRPRYELRHVEQFIRQEQAARPSIQEQLVSPDTVAPVLSMAVMMDDAELREELEGATFRGSNIDLVAFEVLAGEDRHGQPTIWIRSGLRAGMNYVITLPFTAQEVLQRSGAQQW